MKQRGEEFGNELRLKTASEFDHVFARPCRSVSRCFTILARQNERDHPRLGLVISKRCAKTAVQRNRFKRLVRESFRRTQQQLIGLDIIVIGKPGITAMTNQELQTLLAGQWQELQRCRRS